MLFRSAFEWADECEKAFLKLKEAMMNPPVLKLLEPGKPYEIWTDASDFAIGVVLHQEGRPVAFLSMKLENKWPTHEREMYSIFYSFKQWYVHLMEATGIIVFTDNVTVKYFIEQPRLTSKQMRWQEFLQRFLEMEIKYKPGKENVVADALSRREIWLKGVWQVQSDWPDKLKEAYKEDKVAKSWLASLAKSQKVAHVKVNRAGILMWKQSKGYVLEKLRLQVMTMFHDSPWAGHVGQKASYALLRKQCYWSGMKEDMVTYV